MNNEMVLEGLHSAKRRVTSKFVLVTDSELKEAGWEGSLPTLVFTKFKGYWVRLDRQLSKYKVVKVEPWMLSSKSETPKDLNAPLPISGKPKFNLKEMYKNQIKDSAKPKK